MRLSTFTPAGGAAPALLGLAALVALGLAAPPRSKPARPQTPAAARSTTRADGPGSVPGPLVSAIAEVEAHRRSTPLVSAPSPAGEVKVTFLARRAGGRVPRIVSDVTGWGDRADGTFDVRVGTMRKVGTGGWYALDATMAPGARVEYLIAYGIGDYRLDPHNPRRSPLRGGGPASELVAPGYAPPQVFEDPPVSPAGTVTEVVVDSSTPGGARRVAVYTPPGPRPDRGYALAVFYGGSHLPRVGELPRVLDWLLARESIVPVVAAFVDAEARGEDGGAPDYRFLARDLPAWLSSRLGVTEGPGQRAIIGISYNARDTLEIALSTGAFGRVGLLIPGRVVGRAGLEAIGAPRAHRLRVAILAATYDQANIETARGARRAFAAAGDAVDFLEVPEGHSMATWRNHMASVLASLFRPPPARLP